MGKLVSFDIFSDFGFFKKPDINDFGLTYNLPPKSVILGIIGSILGLTGLGKQYDEIFQLKEILDIGHALTEVHNKTKHLIKKVDFDAVQNGLESLKFKKQEKLLEMLKLLGKTKEKEPVEIYDELKEIITELEIELQYPEYYRQLKHLNIGIKPPSEGFPFNKIMNKYNTRNSYFGGAKYDNNIISEQLLIRPKYRIYVYDDTEKILNELVVRIKNKNPIFMPYLGKNEFIANFDNLEIITDIKPIKNRPKTHISSVFLRSTKIENNESDNEDEYHLRGATMVTGLPQGFKFLEYYPVGYLNKGMQYEFQVAEFTAQSVEMSKIDLDKGKLFEINEEIIYLS
ncbi:MAG: CRISPR-associated protein Cas5 [Rhabdochlamydiaceae bacterium]